MSLRREGVPKEVAEAVAEEVHHGVVGIGVRSEPERSPRQWTEAPRHEEDDDDDERR